MSNEIVAVELREPFAIAARRGPRLRRGATRRSPLGRGSADTTRARPRAAALPPGSGSRAPRRRRRAARASARPPPRARSIPPRGSPPPSSKRSRAASSSACASASRPGSSSRRAPVMASVGLAAGKASRSTQRRVRSEASSAASRAIPSSSGKPQSSRRLATRRAMLSRRPGRRRAQALALGGLEHERLRGGRERLRPQRPRAREQLEREPRREPALGAAGERGRQHGIAIRAELDRVDGEGLRRQASRARDRPRPGAARGSPARAGPRCAGATRRARARSASAAAGGSGAAAKKPAPARRSRPRAARRAALLLGEQRAEQTRIAADLVLDRELPLLHERAALEGALQAACRSLRETGTRESSMSRFWSVR